MDATALSLCMDNDMPIYVFNVDDAANIGRVVRGEDIGTVVSTGRRVAPLPPPRTSPSEEDEMTVDELVEDAKTRMDKSVEAMRHELTGVRTGRASAALLDRIQVTTTARGHRSTSSRRSACRTPRLLDDHPVRQERDQGHRARGARVRSGPQPRQRRQRRAAADPAAHRGPPQGARQGRAPHRRGGPHRRAQRAPRRAAPPQGPRPRGRGAGRRACTAPRIASRSSPTST